MDIGKALKAWRQERGWTQIRLAQELPEPLTDGQMIARYEKSSDWFGSELNGTWLAGEGAFPLEALSAADAQVQAEGAA